MKTIYLAHSTVWTVPAPFLHQIACNIAGPLERTDGLDVGYSNRSRQGPCPDQEWFDDHHAFIANSDLTIVLLDFPSEILESVVRLRSSGPVEKPLWCFIPRGTATFQNPIATNIANLVNAHAHRNQQSIVQRIFPYDQLSNVTSLVRSMFLQRN